MVLTHLRLLDFLRDELGLTGTKDVCSEGECGACTVSMDGETINSCLIFAVEAHGSNLITIEGITDKGRLNELQKAFVNYHSVQCGYCIPGIILSAEQIIKDFKNPNRENIKEGLAGNICRCTGYQKIIDAVEVVSSEL
ncbi:MAG: (2Fe-2S)-binding protein [Candidatus Marinimicrobia bacterium]|nr:(2Fe-2S)-binding protein [Candidatus Neomarinimicrobiota bacterium]